MTHLEATKSNKNPILSNSTDEHQRSVHNHPLVHSDTPIRRVKHHSESDSSERLAISQSVNAQKTFENDQQLRRGASMMSLEAKVAGLESELQAEKKKTLKFQKILSTKTERQKQLEEAYRLIAVQLKKSLMSNPPPCFCKNKVAPQIKQQRPESLNFAFQEQLQVLKQQNNQLKRKLSDSEKEISNIRAQLSNVAKLRQRINIQNSKQLKDSEIQALRKECDSLNEVILQLQKQIQNAQLNSKNDKKQDNNLDKYQPNQKHGIQEYVSPSSLQPQKAQLTIFRSFDNEKPEQKQVQPVCNSRQNENKSEKGSPIKLGVQQRQLGQQDNSFATARQISRQSFHTIYLSEARQSQISNENVNQQQLYSSFVSIIQDSFADFNNLSKIKSVEKSGQESALDLDNFLAEYSIKEQLQEQPDKNPQSYENQVLPSDGNQEVLKAMLKKMGFIIQVILKALNTYLFSSAITITFQPIDELLQFLESSMINTDDKFFEISQKIINGLGLFIESKLDQGSEKKIKHLKKEINDLKLTLFESQQKIKILREQKVIMTKKISNLTTSYNRLQCQVAEISLSSPHSIFQSQMYLYDSHKNKVNQDPETIDKSVDCIIINHIDYYELKEFIFNIPSTITTILGKAGIDVPQKEIKTDKNLKDMFFELMDEVVSEVKKNTAENRSYSKRKKSLSFIEFKREKTPLKIEELKQVQDGTNENILQTQQDLQSIKHIVQINKINELQRQLEEMALQLRQRNQQIFNLKQRIYSQKLIIDGRQKKRESAKLVNHQSKVSNSQQSHFTSVLKRQQLFEASQNSEVEFREPSKIREYNNVLPQFEDEINRLKIRNQLLQKQIQELRTKSNRVRKAKIFYINH